MWLVDMANAPVTILFQRYIIFLHIFNLIIYCIVSSFKKVVFSVLLNNSHVRVTELYFK